MISIRAYMMSRSWDRGSQWFFDDSNRHFVIKSETRGAGGLSSVIIIIYGHLRTKINQNQFPKIKRWKKREIFVILWRDEIMRKMRLWQSGSFFKNRLEHVWTRSSFSTNSQGQNSCKTSTRCGPLLLCHIFVNTFFWNLPFRGYLVRRRWYLLSKLSEYYSWSFNL